MSPKIRLAPGRGHAIVYPREKTVLATVMAPIAGSRTPIFDSQIT